jgi:hypothetical protein
MGDRLVGIIDQRNKSPGWLAGDLPERVRISRFGRVSW